MQNATRARPTSADFSLCDASYAAVADALCDTPFTLKGISDAPSLNGALGQVAGYISYALMEAHSYGTPECPDTDAAAILETGRTILFEEADGALRFGVDTTSNTIRFEAVDSSVLMGEGCVAIDPEQCGRRDLQLHDMRTVMCELAGPVGGAAAPVATFALVLGRRGGDLRLGAWVTKTAEADTPMPLADLKKQFVLSTSVSR